MGRFRWRTQYDEKADTEAGNAAAVSFVGQESLTQQSFTKDADLNEIMRRFAGDPDAMPVPVLDPRYYGDFTDIPDLRTALDRTRDAVDRFNALPAALRARFHNRPELLHQFVMDPANADQAVELGLLKRVVQAADEGKVPSEPPGGSTVAPVLGKPS